MRALLQKSCKQCTASSIETYYWTIKSLAKLAELADVPTHSKWINDALLQKVKKQKPLTQSKNLAVAGIKALRAYKAPDAKLEKWGKYVTDVSEQYSKIRNKQERTKREAANWPKQGYKAISKLAAELFDEVKHILKKAPGKISFAELAPGPVVYVFVLQQARAAGRPGRPAN